MLSKCICGAGVITHTGCWHYVFLLGWMHAGYPIMGHLDSVKEMVNVEHMRTTGLWGPIHELGHNQQRAGWEFPPHTTEATCNLWSVYVHEKVLGIPRNKAHEALRPACRKERIKGYLEEGAQLKDWSMWTALETYLQVTLGEMKLGLFSLDLLIPLADKIPPGCCLWPTQTCAQELDMS